MAYDTTQLFLVESSGGGATKEWVYEGTDAPSTVAASGYIDNGYSLGMRVGDEVTVKQFATTAKLSLVAYERFFVTSASSSTGLVVLGKAVGTGTASSGAVTVNAMIGKVTTEALSTAAGAEYTLTLTNSYVTANDIILASVDPKTSAGTPGIGGCKAGAGTATITVTNLHASAAFDAALQINFQVIKAAA